MRHRGRLEVEAVGLADGARNKGEHNKNGKTTSCGGCGGCGDFFLIHKKKIQTKK